MSTPVTVLGRDGQPVNRASQIDPTPAPGEPGVSRPAKVVVIGDAGVGKTSLCYRFAAGKFHTEYLPTVFDDSSTPVAVTSGWAGRSGDDNGTDGSTNGSRMVMLWDVRAHGSEMRELRSLSYAQTDIFLLCFSGNVLPLFPFVFTTDFNVFDPRSRFSPQQWLLGRLSRVCGGTGRQSFATTARTRQFFSLA
jgi:Ras family